MLSWPWPFISYLSASTDLDAQVYKNIQRTARVRSYPHSASGTRCGKPLSFSWIWKFIANHHRLRCIFLQLPAFAAIIYRLLATILLRSTLNVEQGNGDLRKQQWILISNTAASLPRNASAKAKNVKRVLTTERSSLHSRHYTLSWPVPVSSSCRVFFRV